MFTSALAAFALSFAALASAQTPPITGATNLKPGLNNNYCLTAEGTTAGSVVDIELCSGAANQAFTFQNGQVSIFNGTQCLDVINGGGDGTHLQIWNCVTGNSNQQWYYTSDDRLAWTNHGKCLDVQDGVIAGGRQPQVYACGNGNNNQVWNAFSAAATTTSATVSPSATCTCA